MKHFKLTPQTNPMRGQGGFTLVEFLVAMGLGLLVVAIAGGALLLGRQGFDAVDSGAQLRDKQRLAVDLLTRTIVQAGFEDYSSVDAFNNPNATFRANFKDDTTSLEPDIFGWNNAIYTRPGIDISATTAITNGDRPGKCGGVSDTSCANLSDILVVRYQGVSSPKDATKSDNSMINCGGNGDRGLVTSDLNERGVSMFHVTTMNGEPSLSCSYFSHAASQWQNQPLIEGVESFQLLYGTDGVTPGVVSTGAQDSVAERWLRADQLTVAGNPVATRDNWRRVRSVRVGLVLRGPAGSAQQAKSETFNPFGLAYQDSDSDLTVPIDRRLRAVSTFTVHVRNDLTTR